jgi:hypothetical protein
MFIAEIASSYCTGHFLQQKHHRPGRRLASVCVRSCAGSACLVSAHGHHRRAAADGINDDANILVTLQASFSY